MSEAQDAVLREAVLIASLDTPFDWRTPAGLAGELNCDETEVQQALEDLAWLFRHPYGDRASEQHLFRLRRLPMTRGERWRRLREMLTRG